MVSYTDKNYLEVYMKFARDIITHIANGMEGSYKIYSEISDIILCSCCLKEYGDFIRDVSGRWFPGFFKSL